MSIDISQQNQYIILIWNKNHNYGPYVHTNQDTQGLDTLNVYTDLKEAERIADLLVGDGFGVTCQIYQLTPIENE